MISTVRLRVALVLVLAALLGGVLAPVVPLGPLGQPSAMAGAPTDATATLPPLEPVAEQEDNVFLPDDRNLSDCLSSLPKPECGSESRGGAGQLITFAVLMLGMAFIGWRIFLGVRRRDRAETPTP